MNSSAQAAVLCAPALGLQASLLRAAKEQIELAEADFGGDYQRSDAALLVAGPGTNEATANAVITKLARLLWEGMGFAWAVACYSDTAAPDAPTALAQVERLGFRRVVVFFSVLLEPNRLTPIHAAVAAYRRAHPDLIIAAAGSLDSGAAVAAAGASSIPELASGTDNDNCLTCRYRPRPSAAYPADDDSSQLLA